MYKVKLTFPENENGLVIKDKLANVRMEISSDKLMQIKNHK
jgi:hypothetical protein